MLLSLQKYIDVIIIRDHNVIYILYKIYYYIYIYIKLVSELVNFLCHNFTLDTKK